MYHDDDPKWLRIIALRREQPSPQDLLIALQATTPLPFLIELARLIFQLLALSPPAYIFRPLPPFLLDFFFFLQLSLPYGLDHL